MKHEHGTKGATPAFDTVGRGDMRGMPLPARPTASCHVAFVFFKPTQLRLWPIRTKSGRLGPYRHESVVSAVSVETAEMVDSGQNSKKKEVQNTPFELNIKPSFSSLHTNTPNLALYLSLSQSLTRLSLSLCSLPLSLLTVRHSASAELVT